MTVNTSKEDTFDIFHRYSNLNKLKQVMAYCLRFKNNINARIEKTNVSTGYLTSFELNEALTLLTILAQKTAFN